MGVAWNIMISYLDLSLWAAQRPLCVSTVCILLLLIDREIAIIT